MASWNAISDKQKKAKKKASGSSGNLFMKLGAKEQIRLVGKPESVNVAWINGSKFIVPEDLVEKVQETEGVDVRVYYVSNIIDRNDEKLRFKILEKGPGVFKPIIARFQDVKDDDGSDIEPGGAKGGDWLIVKEGTGKSTSYNVSYMKETPFTQEEKELIALTKKVKEDPESYKELPLGEKGLIDLKRFYDQEKAREKLEEYFKTKSLAGGEVDEEADTSDDSDLSADGSDQKVEDLEDLF